MFVISNSNNNVIKIEFKWNKIKFNLKYRRQMKTESILYENKIKIYLNLSDTRIK